MTLTTSTANITKTEARRLTNQIKTSAETLRERLLDAYDRGAHIALGYTSWEHYFTQEFGDLKLGWRRGYQLLEAARVDRILDAHCKELQRRPSEPQARILHKLGEPERIAETWEALNTNGAPSTADVQAAVSGEVPVAPPPPAVCGSCGRPLPRRAV